MSAFQTVEPEDVRVMFTRASDDTSAAIQRAWAEFEAVVGLKGRKFFGVYDPETREYSVCAQLREGDEPGALGLDVGTLPGGTYLRARLHGEPPEVYQQIPSTFDVMVMQADVDPSRPSIEFYRSRAAIDLLPRSRERLLFDVNSADGACHAIRARAAWT